MKFRNIITFAARAALAPVTALETALDDRVHLVKTAVINGRLAATTLTMHRRTDAAKIARAHVNGYEITDRRTAANVSRRADMTARTLARADETGVWFYLD